MSEVAPLGIDEIDKAVTLVPSRKKSQQFSINGPFAIVRHNYYLTIIQSLLDKRAHARPCTMIKFISLFTVEPHHLLTMGNDASLTGRRRCLACNYASDSCANPREFLYKALASLVSPDNPTCFYTAS